MNPSELLDQLNQVLDGYQQPMLHEPFDPANPIVRLHEPAYGPDEIREALQALVTTRITMGPKVKAFEKEFAAYTGLDHGVMVNSGSSANLLAVATLCNPESKPKLNPGDEVIVPALCWSTTVWPLVQHGLTPVVVDIDPKTLNVDPNEIERAIGPKTRGIKLVHVYGNPCDMDAIMDIVKRHNLILIEDCCEASGAFYKGESVGSFGDVGTFSFYFSHHITTLEGGMCVTRDHERSELMRVLRAHGWTRDMEDPQPYNQRYADIDARFLFVNVGFNLRATELQGGFGQVQLKKLPAFVDTRTRNATLLTEAFQAFDDRIQVQQTQTHGTHAWFGFPVQLTEQATFDVKDITAYMKSKGIETRPIIVGNIAIQPGFKMYPNRVVGDLQHSTRAMTHGFAFGNHQSIDDAARQYVIDTFQSYLDSNS